MPTVLTKTTDALGAVRVMIRSGLVPFPRLDRGIASLAGVARFGPFAGPVHAHARTEPRTPALVDELGTLDYGTLDASANALARAWHTAGITAEHTAAVLCRNHRWLVVTMLASAKNGNRLVLMNTGFGAPQLAGVATREGVHAFVFDDEFAPLADALDPSVARYRAWVDDPAAETTAPTLADTIARTDDSDVSPPDTPGGFVLLTSGTTGTPKGAPRGRTSPLASAQFLDRVPLRRGQRMMMAAPAFHGTGVSQLAIALALGQCVVTARRFDPENTVALVAEHACDALVVVPTMLQRIVDLGPDVLSRYDTSHLSIVFAAGSPISPDLSARTARAFGPVLYNLYGSTEVAVATVATPGELAEAPGTAGRPPVTCHVALYDDEGHRITQPGVTGRIFVASGLSFEGYTDGRDKERRDGLLSTGDVGHFDSRGLLFVDGRDDDMIVSGGENVYPLEVENLLADHEEVMDVAVIGVEDPEFGHRLRAFVVPTANSARDADALRAHVKARLARYKVPRDVVFVDELPRNTTGKLLRRALTDLEPEPPAA
ncbi:acyl-CoA synthetase [Rhodococcus sp. HNM0569]|uniref:acyl-CoA synthetase n=1 Tax=Rhodococcus sp. HNM0569 TaxID=2716340 RepID=UPI00197D99CE|nr:acyl-CoA synthetase [Rhodococcus sp. HNM0569]